MAARLDKPDWQILLKLRADGFETLLPDVQAMRSLGKALAVRFRAEIAGGRVDDAIRTAKTMFGMARRMGEHPTFIGELVGFAIAFTAINPLEEMLEQPGCPNLYWALTNLPDPFISIKTGLDGERLSIWGCTRDLDSSGPIGAEQIRKFIGVYDKLVGENSPDRPPGGIQRVSGARTKDEAKDAEARKRLVESGCRRSCQDVSCPTRSYCSTRRELRARFDEFAKIMRSRPGSLKHGGKA